MFESRQTAAIRIAENINGRDLIHADAPVTHAPALIHLEYLFVYLDVVSKVGAVADAAQLRDLLLATHPGQIISFVGKGAHEVGLRLVAHRCFGRKSLPRLFAIARHQLPPAVGFLVEGYRIRQPHLVVQVLVKILVELR